MNRLKNILRSLTHREGAEAKFFRKPYAERIAEVTSLYGDDQKRQAMAGYFERTDAQIADEQSLNVRLFYDVLLGVARVAEPGATMQLGCFTATELQWLRSNGLGGKLIAADHSPDYLAFLEQGFANTPFNGFEYRCFNLDHATPDDFAGVEMVTAMAVLSNIQPESMDALFEAMIGAGVRTILIGDMYVAGSLAGAPDKATALPLQGSRNWAHPYRGLARRHGFRCTFAPCFTYSSFREARGIWLLSRDLDDEQCRTAFHIAVDHYLTRQDAVWDAYGDANQG